LNTSTFFLRHLKAKGKLLFFPKSLIKIKFSNSRLLN